MPAEWAGAVVRRPAVDARLVELVLAGQLAEHVAGLKVAQADLRRAKDRVCRGADAFGEVGRGPGCKW